MPDGRSRNSERTCAWTRRTRRRQESEINLNGQPEAGENFEFTVSSKRRLTRVAAYIGQSRVCEVSSVDPPHSQTVQIPPDAAGLTPENTRRRFDRKQHRRAAYDCRGAEIQDAGWLP